MISRRDFLKGVAVCTIPIPLYPEHVEGITRVDIPKGQWGEDTYQLVIRNDGIHRIAGAAHKDKIEIKLNGSVIASYFNADGDGARIAAIWTCRAGDVVHWTGNGIIPQQCGAFHMHREQWKLLYGEEA